MTEPEPMFTGDLEPTLSMTLKDKTGAPLDASGADIIMVGIRKRDGVEVFNGPPATQTLVDGATLVTRPWEAGETELPGRVIIWARVIWPGNRPQTFRPMASINILPAYNYVHVPTP